MPSRILREGILTSDRVNSLTPQAEVFYRRLMSVVDDYGRFDGRPSILRVSCYPLRVDAVREADISRLIAECVTAGLIVFYAVDAKFYLEMQDFKQQTRTNSKYPPPSDGQVVDCVNKSEATDVHPPRKRLATAKQMSADVHLVGVGVGVVSEFVLPPTVVVDDGQKPPINQSHGLNGSIHKTGPPKNLSCPAEKLLLAFTETLPELPRVIALSNTRRQHLQTRWREVDQAEHFESEADGIEVFRGLFRQVARSDFLMGRASPTPGRKPFKASFDWLINPQNFLKVAEGNYDNNRNR